jgi:hypothetical protein
MKNLVLALLLFGCATEKAKMCPGGGFNQQSPACSSCIAQNCGAQAESCFGAGWQSGDFSGGTCELYFDCACRCARGDDGCFQMCTQKMLMGCEPCYFISVGRCAAAACGALCDAASDGGTGD